MSSVRLVLAFGLGRVGPAVGAPRGSVSATSCVMPLSSLPKTSMCTNFASNFTQNFLSSFCTSAFLPFVLLAARCKAALYCCMVFYVFGTYFSNRFDLSFLLKPYNHGCISIHPAPEGVEGADERRAGVM